MLFSAEDLKTKARELGFNLVGITRAEPSPTLAAYMRWIEAGMHGEMGYMARPDRVARRRDLSCILPGAQSMVVVGMDYRSLDISDEILRDLSRGRIASYAWNLDYHDVMTPRLEELARWVCAEWRQSMDFRVYVDTGAILERSHGQQAGLGFVGKNTMLIHPRRGSYFFLGEMLLDIAFDQYDAPHRLTMCGSCARCLTACPTDAFPQPYVLDSRRCISYHTIENKGWIDRDLRPQFGNWVFGCDICQDVCPFQRFALTAEEKVFFPVEAERVAPKLIDLLMLDAEAFRLRYAGTPIFRIKRHRLARNACIAAGNWGSEQAIPYLIQLLYDENPLVRGHAAWALWRIMGYDSARLLTNLYDRDDNPEVRAEIEALIG